MKEIMDKQFEDQTEKINLLEVLEQGGKLQEAIAPIYDRASQQSKNHEFCSDGRFCSHDKTIEKNGLAGQGILLIFNLAELQDFITRQKEVDKPEAIASHVGCGAAGIAFNLLQQKLVEDPSSVKEIFSWLQINELPATSDELGQIFTKRLAREVGTEYYHMANESMISSEHNESGIIIKAIPFDESFVKVGEQQWFNSSAAKLGLSLDYVKAEITELTKIAFGGHGRMGHHQDENFYLLVVSDESRAADLRQIAEQVASDPAFSGRIKVDVFVGPESK